MKTIKNKVNLIFSFVLFFSIIINNHTYAENPETKTGIKIEKLEKSLLWKVEGEGIKPSFVFGTVHLIPVDDFRISPAVKSAFESSDKIVLELDLDDPALQMEMFQQGTMRDGQTLDQLISEDDYDKLNDMLTASVGVGIEPFNAWVPFLTGSLLLGTVIDGQPASFEGSFIEMAAETNKEVLGLETVEEHLAAFHEISYQAQVKSLLDYLYEQDRLAKEFEELVDYYLAEDPDEIYEYTNNQMKKQNYDSYLLLDKRNNNWISSISELSKDSNVFYAVGAAHLGGEQGVIRLLREKGFIVSPISE